MADLTSMKDAVSGLKLCHVSMSGEGIKKENKTKRDSCSWSDDKRRVTFFNHCFCTCLDKLSPISNNLIVVTTPFDLSVLMRKNNYVNNPKRTAKYTYNALRTIDDTCPLDFQDLIFK